ATQAALVAEKVRARLATGPWTHRACTASIGVATLRPQINGDPHSLVARADRALYQAKRHGRNRVEVFAHWD
ncbi:MAG TPA: GGDEF domain-containing protein, partial [Burkholderiaceae bacterium]|nr:GGDEF domain-containing protein [Burkholderiaceae bacterium]